MAHTQRGFVIVTNITASTIDYMSEGEYEAMHIDEFISVWDGNVLLSFPNTNAHEPDYKHHKEFEFFVRAKQWVLLACAVCLLLYMFITQGLYHNISTIFIALFDLGGIYFTYLPVSYTHLTLPTT